MSASATTEAEQQSCPEPKVASQPKAESSRTAKNSPELSRGKPNLLLDLPKDILDTILLILAKEEYESLYRLSGTCQALRQYCRKFIANNPQHLFRKFKCRPAGMSESDCSDDDDCVSVNWSDRSDDILEDDIAELLDELSFGSNCDEEALEQEWRRHEAPVTRKERENAWQEYLREQGIEDEAQVFRLAEKPFGMFEQPGIPRPGDPNSNSGAGAGADVADADEDADAAEELW